MIDPTTQAQLKEAIADCINTDQGILDRNSAVKICNPPNSTTRNDINFVGCN